MRTGALGDFVLAAAYIPPVRKGAGALVYVEYWESMLETARRLQLRHGVAAQRLAIVGDMNAHLGALPGGSVPEEVLQARHWEGYTGY